MTALDWSVLVGYFVLILVVRAIVKWGIESTDTTLVVALPLATSLVVYVGLGLLFPERRTEVDELVDSLNSDPDEIDEIAARRAAAVGLH
jgi:nitrate reductase gamma subunit